MRLSCAHRPVVQSNTMTLRATSPFCIASNASLFRSRRMRCVIIASRWSLPASGSRQCRRRLNRSGFSAGSSDRREDLPHAAQMRYM